LIQDDERQDDAQEPEAQEPEAPEGQEPEAPEAAEPEEAPEAQDPGPDIEGAEEMAAAAEEAPEADTDAEAAPDAEEPKPEPKRKGKKDDKKKKDEVIPGEHLEPDLVLEEEAADEAAVAAVEAVAEDGAPAGAEADGDAAAEATEPEPRRAMDLAADARYQATGKRKTAVARVILRPGSGTYQVNGRALDQFFPRIRLQRIAKQPLETAGYQAQMDVVAKIHGGGVSAQAGALRHGIARALVDADPSLRVELKRRGFLTRDPREKERKKAGLKKARKRPQFSKR
jgi:small subunit ribosomal protein S9